MTFTFSPEQVLCSGGFLTLISGILLLTCFSYRLKGKVPRWVQACGWTGLAAVVLGGVSMGVGSSIRSDRIFAEKLATLPTEWQEFRAHLDELEPFSLAQEALERFVKSNPPSITPKQYAILVNGSAISQNGRDRLFDDSRIRSCVAMPFVGGKSE